MDNNIYYRREIEIQLPFIFIITIASLIIFGTKKLFLLILIFIFMFSAKIYYKLIDTYEIEYFNPNNNISTSYLKFIINMKSYQYETLLLDLFIILFTISKLI